MNGMIGHSNGDAAYWREQLGHGQPPTGNYPHVDTYIREQYAEIQRLRAELSAALKLQTEANALLVEQARQNEEQRAVIDVLVDAATAGIKVERLVEVMGARCGMSDAEMKLGTDSVFTKALAAYAAHLKG